MTGSVLEAARSVLARDRSASLDEVARAAGVSRATVYRQFGSRQGLLQALGLEQEAGSRERVLAAALELLDRDGLGRLSMDEVAAAAGVSRASLYRLFPGKPALFREVLREYAPLEAIRAVVESMRDRPADEVVPEAARTAARTMRERVGLIRTLVFEVTSGSEDSAEAARYVLVDTLSVLAGYLVGEMEAGRLRPMHPLLALQALAGPVLLHLITRRVAEQLVGLDVDVEDAVAELANAWVRAMRPEEAER